MAAALQCEICGGKLVGKPGGIFECDSCGMEYSTEWAKQKIQEIKGTVKVEGTVEVTGSVKLDGPVKVEGSVSVKNLLKRIHICAQDKETDKIVTLAEQILNIEPECGEAYLWLLMAERKVFQPDQLFQCSLQELTGLKAHKHWKNALHYLPAEDAEQLEKKLTDRLVHWNQENPYLRQRNHQIQPAQNLVHAFSGGGLVALKADGMVYVTYTKADEWLEPVKYWSDIKELVSNRFGMLLGLGWDGTVRAVCENPQELSKIISAISKWENIRTVSIIDKLDHDVVVGLQEDGTLVSTYLNVYEDGGPDSYILRKGKSVYYALSATGWTDVKQINILSCNGGGNHCYIAVGLTVDGRLRLSDVSAVPDMCKIWEKYDCSEHWKDIDKHCWGWNYLMRDGSSYFLLDDTKSSMVLYLDDRITLSGTANIGIASRYHEVANVIGCDFHVALLADGRVVADIETCRASQKVESPEWSNMVAVKECGALCYEAIVGIREDGNVLLEWFDKEQPGISVAGWKLFESLSTLEQEREEANRLRLERIRLQEEEEARRKEQEALRRAQEQERIRAQKERQRVEKLAALEAEQTKLQNDLHNLRGLFTGKRRREIEAQLAEIDSKLKALNQRE